MENNIPDKLILNKFTINKPFDWELDTVQLEINSYVYDSTNISLDDLKLLHDYIGKILKIY